MSGVVPARPPLRLRLAQRGLDGATLLLLPALLFVIVLFVYPFLYGVVLSFHPLKGAWYADYATFFGDRFEYGTIATTFAIALPATLVNTLLAIPIAMRVRLTRHQKLLATILLVPITLGTVLVAEGLLTYLGPQGWLNRVLIGLHLVSAPIRLVHNYWGVFLSLVITGFPFSFLLTLSYASGIDPALERAAAMLGGGARQRFFTVLLPLLLPGLAITFCLSFVQAFAVFPSALLLGAPSGPTRVISIAAYEAAFEQFDYPLASAIAVIMALAQVMVVGMVLWARGLVYRGPAGGGKG